MRYRCISESGVASRWSRLISQRGKEIEIEQMCPGGIYISSVHFQLNSITKFYYTPDFTVVKISSFIGGKNFFDALVTN